MIVIAYDGSDDAKEAIAQAARLFPTEQVVILTVWQRFIDTMARSGATVGAPSVVDLDDIDHSTEHTARDRAEAGVQYATELGLDAHARIAVLRTTVPDAILHESDMLAAKAIVMGSRGLTGIKSALLGSVSHGVLHHADRPVVIVPAPNVIEARAAHIAKL